MLKRWRCVETHEESRQHHDSAIEASKVSQQCKDGVLRARVIEGDITEIDNETRRRGNFLERWILDISWIDFRLILILHVMEMVSEETLRRDRLANQAKPVLVVAELVGRELDSLLFADQSL